MCLSSSVIQRFTDHESSKGHIDSMAWWHLSWKNEDKGRAGAPRDAEMSWEQQLIG